MKRKEADNAIIFTFIIIKVRYNLKYLAINFKKEDKIFLKLY